jgi:hypothetical protein
VIDQGVKRSIEVQKMLREVLPEELAKASDAKEADDADDAHLEDDATGEDGVTGEDGATGEDDEFSSHSSWAEEE